MNRCVSLILSIAAVLVLSTGAKAQTEGQKALLKNEIEKDLVDNILPFWEKYSPDPAGGFYGTVSREGTGDPHSPKAGVLNTRILWTFSSAYRICGLPQYKEMADRAQKYVIENLIDKKYGGIYWLAGSDGTPADATKQTYATAFGIYSLSEHFRATGNKQSLQKAIELYEVMETKVHDKVGKGWLETHTRDWNKPVTKGVDGKEGATKTMNTHIHVMEAYTNLYRVWPDAGLRENLLELLDILQTKLYDPQTKHLILFCDDNWNSLGNVDSYGHDIETSWLMSECAAVLGDEDLIAKVNRQAVDMVDTALAEGVNPDGSMIYELDEGIYRRNLQWWPQCESIVGCINAWQITGQKKYFDAAVRTWEFVKGNFIDREYGGWFKNLSADRVPDTRDAKGSTWNCPYHNSRMGFEILSRLAPDVAHTEVMAWSNITGIRLDGENIDFESRLCVGTVSGSMERTGRERQNKIKYRREGLTQITETPMHGAKFVQTVTELSHNTVSIKWEAEALETLKEAAYFSLTFTPEHYSDAAIKAFGRKLTVTSPDRSIDFTFNKPVKTLVREENGDKVVYVTLLPSLKKGTVSELSASVKVDGIRFHETAHITLDLNNPGREFAGFGGNFRIQSPAKDPEVIDYCLNNMRVAFGRVEFPWNNWDKAGTGDPHVIESAEMARRLKQVGMPVIVSCWFPPQWAGIQTTRSDGSSKAYSLKPEEKDRIYESIASYLVFLKKNYGVEADYFSFNESDLGIDVVFTPDEHRDFIKEFGCFLADKGLKTLMLLGDNSDASTFDFIIPTLEDASAHKYVGAISFHSWRGCDDVTLAKWAAASRRMNVPLIVGEGSTDAAAHQYPDIFKETTFALYEINLYTRICAACQPLSILQWQLTSDYSLLWGDGIYRSEGPLRPTQRFFNLKQLSMTPENVFAIPLSKDKENVTVAAFANTARGESAVHIVNNGASCPAEVTGLPAGTTKAYVYVTDAARKSEAQLLPVKDGVVTVFMPADSFVSIISE